MRTRRVCRGATRALILAGALTAPAGAQDEPVVAGEGGVPAPKPVKIVKPEYPPEAVAQGIRGIVIVEVVIDEQGKVESARVTRSVPPFDEITLAAIKQWQFEPTKVSGKPVRVRHSVPVTFAIKLPPMSRAAGVPELRAGAAPLYPKEGRGNAGVTAEVTLDATGLVAEAQITKGEDPFSTALLQAIRSWRFVADGTDEVASFRLEADFVEGDSGAGRVDLRLSNPRRSQALAPAPVPAEPSPPAEPAPSPSPAAPATEATASPTPPTASPSAPPLAPKPAPPPVEIINVPPKPAPPIPEQTGVSAIRDVTLSDGVPDLTRGRRPMAPPLARMGGLSGSVEVQFSVDAAGVARVKSATGPEILKTAAEDTVASWVFRRTTAERLALVAVIAYSGDKASATIQVQPEEPAPPPAAPSPPPAP